MTAAEGGLYLAAALLLVGPLWASGVGNVVGVGAAPDAHAPALLHLHGPAADARIVVTLLVSLAAYTLIFAGLWWIRYVTETAYRQAQVPFLRRLQGATS